MAIITFNGPEGTRWLNQSTRVGYQFHASLINTCGTCLQYHLAIKYGPWPIPIHRGCRCGQFAVAPGKEAQPFADFQKLLSEMPHSQQVAAVGAANWRLIESGLATFADVVTSTRVRPFFEVVARGQYSLKSILKSGVTRGTATKAYATVHTPAIELAKKHANELIQRIVATGISREQVSKAVGQHFAAKIGVKLEPKVMAPKPIPVSDVRPLIEGLKAVQRRIMGRQAARVVAEAQAANVVGGSALLRPLTSAEIAIQAEETKD